jgi:hypothetical protein
VYCTYYVNAAPDLSFISLNDGRQALKVEFDLIPHPTPNWQNWLSIRKPFAAPVDLSSFTGIRINLFVEDPANAVLRLSLADIGEDDTSDEIWWCNTRNVLNNPDGGWQLVECPFDQFVLGNVGRNNDFTFNYQQIVAYEITLISDPGASPSGSFIVDKVEAYGTDG